MSVVICFCVYSISIKIAHLIGAIDVLNGKDASEANSSFWSLIVGVMALLLYCSGMSRD